jgi:hypothetical protein
MVFPAHRYRQFVDLAHIRPRTCPPALVSTAPPPRLPWNRHLPYDIRPATIAGHSVSLANIVSSLPVPSSLSYRSTTGFPTLGEMASALDPGLLHTGYFPGESGQRMGWNTPVCLQGVPTSGYVDGQGFMKPSQTGMVFKVTRTMQHEDVDGGQ